MAYSRKKWLKQRIENHIPDFFEDNQPYIILKETEAVRLIEAILNHVIGDNENYISLKDKVLDLIIDFISRCPGPIKEKQEEKQFITKNKMIKKEKPKPTEHEIIMKEWENYNY